MMSHVLVVHDAVRGRLRVTAIPGFGVGLQEENLAAGPQLVDVIELMNHADGDGVIDANRPQQGGGLSAFEAYDLVSGVLPHGAR
jgi:hypothetical protein